MLCLISWVCAQGGGGGGGEGGGGGGGQFFFGFFFRKRERETERTGDGGKVRETRVRVCARSFARGKRELERKLPSHCGICIQSAKLERFKGKTPAKTNSRCRRICLATRKSTTSAKRFTLNHEKLSCCLPAILFRIARNSARKHHKAGSAHVTDGLFVIERMFTRRRKSRRRRRRRVNCVSPSSA